MGKTYKNKERKRGNNNKKTKKNKRTKHNKETNKTKKLKNVMCSPDIKDNNFSCYSNENLFILKKYWNENNSDKIRTNEPKEIWKELKIKHNNDCNKESCWLQKSPIPTNDKKLILNTSFAPVAPDEWKQDPNAWLSTLDLLRVLKQYERSHPHFKFLGPSPIDYDYKTSYNQCVWNDLCKFKLSSYKKKNIHKIGVIFNTDPHTSNGAHWISVFIDTKKNVIYFFDSVGRKAPVQVKKFIDDVIEDSKALGKEMIYDELYNHKMEHQFEDTECGMYSLYFIINMLTKKKRWENFYTNKITDNAVSKFRNIYFNKDL
jgi:hypothetical protein